jgi:hypothetical protein
MAVSNPGVLLKGFAEQVVLSEPPSIELQLAAAGEQHSLLNKTNKRATLNDNSIEP